MQGKDSIFLERTDALAHKLGVRMRDLGPLIGISPAMLFGCRSKKYAPSAKTLLKLEQAEFEAGIEPPFKGWLRKIETVSKIAESPEAGDTHLREWHSLEEDRDRWRRRALVAEEALEELRSALDRVDKARQSQSQSQSQ